MSRVPASLWSRARWTAAGSRRFLVLIYHRVLPAPDPLYPGDIDRESLATHLKVLTTHFRVRPLGETVRRAWEGTVEPATVCITFDDGYLDNVQEGLPILQRFGASATFFIASGYLDGGCMWNDVVIESVRRTGETAIDATDLGLGQFNLGTLAERAVAADKLIRGVRYLQPDERNAAVLEIGRRLRVPTPRGLMMSPDGVRTLARAGMEIGGHTVTHPILRNCDDAVATEEIGANKRALEGMIDAPVDVFAYPNGRPDRDYGARDVDLVRRAGYAAAVTTRQDAASTRYDRFEVPRFGPWRESATRFRMRMMTLM
jgi:peptidoglycan/xylan/chitin deacetylase (PgdA/CDA1 family)